LTASIFSSHSRFFPPLSDFFSDWRSCAFFLPPSVFFFGRSGDVSSFPSFLEFSNDSAKRLTGKGFPLGHSSGLSTAPSSGGFPSLSFRPSLFSGGPSPPFPSPRRSLPFWPLTWSHTPSLLSNFPPFPCVFFLAAPREATANAGLFPLPRLFLFGSTKG